MRRPIRVFIVDDSPVALSLLVKLVSGDGDCQVVGTAQSGLDALGQIPLCQPDVVCSDLFMRGIDGLAFTKELMSSYPLPILIVSIGINSANRQMMFDLLAAGALDLVKKPTVGTIEQYQKTDLLSKIKLVAGVRVVKRRSAPIQNITLPSQLLYDVVGIGTSTGGPRVLQEIFRHIGRDFPLPIVCTQHISPGFLVDLIRWLQRETECGIVIAQVGASLEAGRIYFAPENASLSLNERKEIVLVPRREGQIYCPSVDVMFSSLAAQYSRRVMAILLTGMGTDGAKGMEAVYRAGGMTIAQEETSCTIFGMPKAAIDMGVAGRVLNIQSIITMLNALQEQRNTVEKKESFRL